MVGMSLLIGGAGRPRDWNVVARGERRLRGSQGLVCVGLRKPGQWKLDFILGLMRCYWSVM